MSRWMWRRRITAISDAMHLRQCCDNQAAQCPKFHHRRPPVSILTHLWNSLFFLWQKWKQHAFSVFKWKSCPSCGNVFGQFSYCAKTCPFDKQFFNGGTQKRTSFVVRTIKMLRTGCFAASTCTGSQWGERSIYRFAVQALEPIFSTSRTISIVFTKAKQWGIKHWLWTSQLNSNQENASPLAPVTNQLCWIEGDLSSSIEIFKTSTEYQALLLC